jgi:hypothetical protein
MLIVLRDAKHMLIQTREFPWQQNLVINVVTETLRKKNEQEIY